MVGLISGLTSCRRGCVSFEMIEQVFDCPVRWERSTPLPTPPVQRVEERGGGNDVRRYDDPVQVQGADSVDPTSDPAQFLWRGRLWKVRQVLARWVETAPWWQDGQVQALTAGTDLPEAPARGARDAGGAATLLAERDCWRVEAGRPGAAPGVFDLWRARGDGEWRLVGCQD